MSNWNHKAAENWARERSHWISGVAWWHEGDGVAAHIAGQKEREDSIVEWLDVVASDLQMHKSIGKYTNDYMITALGVIEEIKQGIVRGEDIRREP